MKNYIVRIPKSIPYNGKIDFELHKHFYKINGEEFTSSIGEKCESGYYKWTSLIDSIVVTVFDSKDVLD